jgi:hypothetical protein
MVCSGSFNVYRIYLLLVSTENDLSTSINEFGRTEVNDLVYGKKKKGQSIACSYVDTNRGQVELKISLTSLCFDLSASKGPSSPQAAPAPISTAFDTSYSILRLLTGNVPIRGSPKVGEHQGHAATVSMQF